MTINQSIPLNGCAVVTMTAETSALRRSLEEVLGEVKEIAARGGIACGCGSAEYGVKVGFSAVDLVCARCGATLRLNAATPDDIDAVCAQYTLTIPGKKEQGL